ncbi:hypothetical protein H6P81_015651 [Aristolochia fimbriata]|uniref:Myb/SANT-like DNA-binding domain-containing protein n=1 Tax=Aristolochia fimbriata TaxID=158543 RepID=A0AAV7E913_ARIFI|nr:hypothetical protein H6P81_015651 [Aristolochia fimbriata]
MDSNLSPGNMVPSSYTLLDLQGPLHVHHQQNPYSFLQEKGYQPSSMAGTSNHNVFPLTMGNLQDPDHSQQLCKTVRVKPPTSDEDEPSITEETVDGHCEVGARGKKASLWQRMKWTDSMIRLLITIVSYLGEDALAEGGQCGRRRFAVLQKKGKWKLVSQVMAERGCYVSPQQCEDKFNDLNKRYKRLTDVLGRGTSCKVVENPALLDLMDHLSEKSKEDVRKILSSKHLFYEEMCSYHNGNRLHLPEDPALHRSLQLALRSRDEQDPRQTQDDMVEADQEADTDERDEETEEKTHSGVSGRSCCSKRIKQGIDYGDNLTFRNPSTSQDCSRRSYQQIGMPGLNCVLPDVEAAWLQSQWMKSYSLQLEEKKLDLQAQMFELEKERVKWQRNSRKKDKELDKLRMENERMKLENEEQALELKKIELQYDHRYMEDCTRGTGNLPGTRPGFRRPMSKYVRCEWPATNSSPTHFLYGTLKLLSLLGAL